MRHSRMNLGGLIVLLSALTALVMLTSSFLASYDVQRQLLIESTLEANHAYAAKLAAGTDTYLRLAIQQLGYSAQLQAQGFAQPALLQQEAERLLGQSASFNSVTIVNREGVVQAVAPASLGLLGRRLDSTGAQAALSSRTALISSPYISAAHNLVVFISYPVIDGHGEFLGYVGGALYLKQNNILQHLLGEHFYKDGSYLYVVDRNRRLLYHPDAERVGTVVEDNILIDRLTHEQTGTLRLVNSEGTEMLAGFATIPTANWGVVAQRPVAKTFEHLNRLMLKVALETLPLALFSFALIWWIARRLSKPLKEMARGAQQMHDPETVARITRVKAWYFEAYEMKRALLLGLGLIHDRIGELRHEVQTDPLTGLNNRRGLELMLELWTRKRYAFSVIALDIDHFKQVNDTYGHDQGDLVLRRIGQLMSECCRDADFPCRTGGEEFLILLPLTGLGIARTVAERLRRAVEHTGMPPVGNVTISLGVAYWPGYGHYASETLKAADDMLYRAKEAGRNQVAVADLD